MKFENIRHKKACIMGWFVFILIAVLQSSFIFHGALFPYIFYPWIIVGYLVLRPAHIADFQDPFDLIPRYSFLVWIGFCLAWPYVVIIKKTDQSKALRFMIMPGSSGSAKVSKQEKEVLKRVKSIESENE